MSQWNMQLPATPGAAGAPPDVLSLAAQGLAQNMGIQPSMAGGYLPTGFGQPISTGAQQWDREQTWTEEHGMAILAQFDQQLQQQLQIAEMDAARAIQVAQTYANAQTTASSASAAAQMAAAESQARATAEAAQIRADAMIQVAQMDTQTRLQIANIQAEVERERTGVMQYEAETGRRIQESTEFGQPINLAAYIHYMTQGPGTVTPGVLPGQAGLPQAAQAPTAPTAANAMAGLYQQGQVGGPVGVVGEGGPEVLNATPGGLQVTPTTPPQAQALMQQGVPGMQYGGTVGRLGQTTGGYSSPYRAQQATTQQANREFNFVDMPRQVAQGRQNIAAQQAMTPEQQAAARARQQASGQNRFQQQLLGGQATAMPSGGGFMQTAGARPGTGMVLRPGHMQLREHLQAQQQQQQAAQQQEAPPQWFLDWQAAQGGGATPGGTPQPVAPGTGAPIPGTPGAAPGATPGGAAGVTGDQDTDWQAFIDQLYGNAPAYGWQGPTTLPEIGVDIPYLPFQQNLPEWQALPSQVQKGRQSMWRALGLTPETQMGMMYQAAPTGIAQPVAGWR